MIGYLSKGHFAIRMDVTSTAAPPPARVLADLGPIAQLRAGRLGRRLPQLYVGLVLYGLSIALMVRGHLGNAPWDVLHSGLARHLPLTLGEALVIVELPGDAALDPAARGARHRHDLERDRHRLSRPTCSSRSSTSRTRSGCAAWLMLGGVVLTALATAMYIGAQLGRGPATA